MGQAFGAARPQVAELQYSDEHDQYIPARTAQNEMVFKRDKADRDKLNVRVTSLVYVKKSEHLKRPKAFRNKSGKLEMRKSINGDGLYAAQELPRFTVVGEYLGEIIRDAAKARGESDYRFAVVDLRNKKTLYTIDGKEKEVSSIVRYANAADELGQVNAEFVQFRARVFLVTNREIKADEELITWYGEDTDVINSSPKRKRATKPEEDVFLLERILQRRRRAGKDEFLVKWQGYADKHNSWEPEGNIYDEKELERARNLPFTKRR